MNEHGILLHPDIIYVNYDEITKSLFTTFNLKN